MERTDYRYLMANMKNYPSFLSASIGKRFISYMIDLFFIRGFSSIIFNILARLSIQLDRGPWTLGRGIEIVFFLSYFSFLNYILDGQTLGMIITGIRLKPLYDEKLKLGSIITREFFSRYIMYKIKVLYLLAIFTPYKQNLGDLLADTFIIDEKKYREYKFLEEFNEKNQ